MELVGMLALVAGAEAHGAEPGATALNLGEGASPSVGGAASTLVPLRCRAASFRSASIWRVHCAGSEHGVPLIETRTSPGRTPQR